MPAIGAAMFHLVLRFLRNMAKAEDAPWQQAKNLELKAEKPKATATVHTTRQAIRDLSLVNMSHKQRLRHDACPVRPSLPRVETLPRRALALTTRQTYRYVLLPRAFRIMIPPLTSEFLSPQKYLGGPSPSADRA